LQTQTQGNPVKKILLLLFCCSFFAIVSLAQSVQDSVLPRQDTVTVKKDTIARISPDSAVVKRPARKKPDSAKVVVTPPVFTETDIPPSDSVRPEQPDQLIFEKIPPYRGIQDALRDHPFFNFYGSRVALTIQEKKVNNKDSLFYFMCGLLLYYGLCRLFFGKYLNNLMALFFRVTMRQQQLRDQLLQSPLPSLFLNILFLVTGGLYLTFVAGYYDFTVDHVTSRWILLGWCSGLIMAIYMGKFIVLKITGWVFNVKAATDTYIFIVFLVNKMIGIFLLPVLVFMAFADPPLFSVILTLSYVMLLFFFIYRFIISYRPIRNEIKVNRFHFFIYLCAFEVAPLLLIYKVLLIFVERSY
jgi:hypothetical protein